MRLEPEEEWNLAAKTVAEQYDNDFPESGIDSEYTETGYAGLRSEVQAVGTWREFHDDVAARLAKMRGE